MKELLPLIKSFNVASIGKACILLAAGLLLASLLRASIGRWGRRYVSLHQTIMVKRFVYYIVLLIFLISALDQLGFEMKALLGFAGIFTVAIGFASQTAASNIISGLFMIGERPFEIGDKIQVDTTFGEVLSLDLLSVKLRKFDNTMIRIPNEFLLKSTMINHSRFPIRRFDFILRFHFQEDLEKIMELLLSVANAHPDCLAKPGPEVVFLEYTDTAIKLQLSSWATEEKIGSLKTSLSVAISAALQKRNINIPSAFGTT